MLQKYAHPFTYLNDSQLCSGCFSSKGLQASWGHIKQHGPPGWKHTENTNQIETLTPLDVNKMCFFSHVRTSDSINTYRTGCPWVWLLPAWCHPPALPWDTTENTPKWSRSATFMIVLLRFGSHALCCCLEMSEGMHEMICWAVLFLVPGTTGTVKTAPCAVWSSCNILYVVYKQILDTQLKEASTRFHFMPTDPFTCYTLGLAWSMNAFTLIYSTQISTGFKAPEQCGQDA